MVYHKIITLKIFFLNIADNQILARRLGGIDTILGAMKMHINNEELCESGCSTLWNITDNGKKMITHLCFIFKFTIRG